MIRKLRFIFLSLFILFLTSSAAFAALPTGTTGNGTGNKPTATYSYNSSNQTGTLTLTSNWILTNPWVITGTTSDIATTDGDGTSTITSVGSIDITLASGTTLPDGGTGVPINILDLGGTYSITADNSSSGGWSQQAPMVAVGMVDSSGWKSTSTPTTPPNVTIQNGTINFTAPSTFEAEDSWPAIATGNANLNLTGLSITNSNVITHVTDGLASNVAVSVLNDVPGSDGGDLTITSCSIIGNDALKIGEIYKGTRNTTPRSVTVQGPNTKLTSPYLYALSTFGSNQAQIDVTVKDGVELLGNGSPTVSFPVNGSLGTSYTSDSSGTAVYLASSQCSLDIGDNVVVTGYTGIGMRGGALNITGDPIISGTGDFIDVTSSDVNSAGATSTGSAINIVGASGTYTGLGTPGHYGDVSITVTGDPKVTSTNGYALEESYVEGTSVLKAGSAETPAIDLQNGTYTSTKPPEGSNGDPFSIQKANQPNANNENQVIGVGKVTTSGPVKPIYLEGVGFVVEDNGEYSYFDKQDDAEKFAQETGGTWYPIDEESPSGIPYPGQGQYGQIYGVTLSPSEILNYYNTNGSSDQSYSLNLSLNVLNTNNSKYNNITPEQLNYAVNPVANSTSTGDETIAFNTQEWVYVDQNGNPNGQIEPGKEGYRALYSANNEWYLMYKYTISSSTGPTVVSWSDLTLNYVGTPATNTGVYTLTATANENNVNSSIYSEEKNNLPFDSVRFIVNQTNVNEVEITGPDGTVLSGLYSVNLNETKTVDFGYLAFTINNSGDRVPTTGHVVNWTLTNPNNTSNNLSSLPYATVDSQTGVVTFFRNLDNNSFLLLTVTVDGVPSNTLAITTSGTLNYDEITGIKSLYNPVNITSGTNLVLNDNVVTTPVEGLVGSGSLTFTTSNPNFIIYQTSPAGTNPVTPGTYQLIPPAGSVNTTTTIVATWTNNGTTYTTEFDVNSVPTENPATGITAQDSLNFVLTNPVSQNVNASLTPENNTTQVGALNGTDNGFKYVSSNTAVAVVDAFGNVSPVAPGTCTITTTFPSNTSLGSATTTITVNEAPETATGIELDYTTVYLAPEGTADATTSADITATVTPDNVDPSSVTWTTNSDNITLTETTGLTTTVSSTAEPGTYTVTASVPGPEDTTLTATCEVIVTDAPVVVDPSKTSISADSPDFYTVTVAPAANPAIEGADSSAIQKVSIFTWSQLDQSDMDCKVANRNSDGTYSYTFPVNNTPVNEYYIDASDIIVQVYASTDPNTDGDMVMNTTWNYADCGWTDEVIATPYVQDQGFIIPSVGNGEIAGTTGEARQMEGIRLSTPIEGVDVVYDVHVESIGWMDQVEEGVYAGTMHANLQMEAVHIKLTGANASQYTVQYQAHVQDIGWMDWVADGAEAGTTGQGLQMEALRVQIVPAGTALPSNNA